MSERINCGHVILLILVIVFIAGLIECRGQDSVYCLPLPIARMVIEDADKKFRLDSVIADLRLDIVRKHLDLQDVERRFSDYRSNAARIQAADRSLSDALEKQARHWQAEARRRERIWKMGRWLIPVAFGLGVLVGK